LDHPFQVRAKRAGADEQFEVTISAKSGRLSPFLYPRLSFPGRTGRVTAPVTQHRAADTATFRFRVPSKALEGAVFELTESNYGVRLGDQGDPLKDRNRPLLVPFMGGTVYNLSLEEFGGQSPIR
ncbi:MAG: hypothetical protein JO250_23100, partial [Armatimonadetes bacterium]|nr:hypothetical protein [Armatimonadota bacterium]